MGAHCRVDHFEWWIEVMFSLGLILQRLCGFTGIYRAARAPKKKEKENQSRIIFHPSLKFKLSFSLSDHCFLRSCPSQGDLQRPLPKKCHYYCRCKEAEKQKSEEAEKAPNCWAQPGKNIAHLLCHQSGPLERLQLGEIGPSRKSILKTRYIRLWIVPPNRMVHIETFSDTNHAAM